MPFRAAASASAANPATSVTIAVPAGTINGDVMIAAILGNSTQELQTPAGWTLVRADTTLTFRQRVYQRVADAEPANYTWTIELAGTGSLSGGIVSCYGIYTGAPVDVHGGQWNASSTSVLAPSVTTTFADTLLIGFFGAVDPSVGGVTPDGAMTERLDVRADTFSVLEGADESRVAIGATGTRTATIGPAAANCGQLIALRPASGDGLMLRGVG